MCHAAKLAMLLVLAAPVLPVLGEDGVPVALVVPKAASDVAAAVTLEAGCAKGAVPAAYGSDPASGAEAGVGPGPGPDSVAVPGSVPASSATSGRAAATAPGVALGVALSLRRLDALRGGSSTPWSEMKLQGAVSGNSTVAVATGANVIKDGAFSNASGLPMVIQNSGANVLIQNATIVNVQFK